MRAFIIGFAIVTMAVQAHAADSDMAKCSAMTNSVERLACFDSLAEKMGAATTTKSLPSSGRWTMSTEKNPLDDSQGVWLSVSADDVVHLGRYKEGRPRLLLRCYKNITALIVSYDTFLGSDDTRVTYRIDKQPARRGRWNISTNHSMVGLWSGGSSIPVIKSMLGKSKMVFEVTPYSESPVVVEFDIAGLEDAIGPLRTTCGW